MIVNFIYIYIMKKVLLITLISGICFFYYYHYYYKNVNQKDKNNIKKIKWNDEIIYIN